MLYVCNVYAEIWRLVLDYMMPDASSHRSPVLGNINNRSTEQRVSHRTDFRKISFTTFNKIISHILVFVSLTSETYTFQLDVCTYMATSAFINIYIYNFGTLRSLWGKSWGKTAFELNKAIQPNLTVKPSDVYDIRNMNPLLRYIYI